VQENKWKNLRKTFKTIPTYTYTLYDFDLTSAMICQNQCKLAKVRVSTHDFQYIRETAYNHHYNKRLEMFVIMFVALGFK
jgi:hypothetical protein